MLEIIRKISWNEELACLAQNVAGLPPPLLVFKSVLLQLKKKNNNKKQELKSSVGRLDM